MNYILTICTIFSACPSLTYLLKITILLRHIMPLLFVQSFILKCSYLLNAISFQLSCLRIFSFKLSIRYLELWLHRSMAIFCIVLTPFLECSTLPSFLTHHVSLLLSFSEILSET
ncbi:hypothetical protein BDQ17DRAFT_1377161 [Cyathus striatus]|nr:hypothetical protein BDQ17DRAFT_1377161 [Cyathus striatus]